MSFYVNMVYVNRMESNYHALVFNVINQLSKYSKWNLNHMNVIVYENNQFIKHWSHILVNQLNLSQFKVFCDMKFVQLFIDSLEYGSICTLIHSNYNFMEFVNHFKHFCKTLGDVLY